MGIPDFGALDFSDIWSVVSALVLLLAVPLVVRYGIIIARKAVSMIGLAMGGGGDNSSFTVTDKQIREYGNKERSIAMREGYQSKRSRRKGNGGQPF